jgi:hypothetical protein
MEEEKEIIQPENNTELVSPPEKVFVVPYRNRYHQKFFFSRQMDYILQGKCNYSILFVHQSDNRIFNRGAMKNIGFISIKEKYPESYKKITFIFNDVDTLPFTKIFDYDTTDGVIKHYYGFEEALGGIVVIKGSDFEKINGYPNFWGWGMEDACLQRRCKKYNLIIDRSHFYPIGSPEILQLFDGVSRLISKKDTTRMLMDNGRDGIRTIHKLTYDINDESTNPEDNYHVVNNKNIKYVNVKNFETLTKIENEEFFEYDLREPKKNIVYSQNAEITNKRVVTTNDWKNIPYYPTSEERKVENIKTQGYQIRQGYLNQGYNQNMNASNIHSQKSKPRASASANVKISLGGLR